MRRRNGESCCNGTGWKASRTSDGIPLGHYPCKCSSGRELVERLTKGRTCPRCMNTGWSEDLSPSGMSVIGESPCGCPLGRDLVKVAGVRGGQRDRRSNPSPSEEIIQRVINETIAAEDGDDAYASPGVIESDMLGNPRSCSRARKNPGVQALVNFEKPGDAIEALGELFNLARKLSRDPGTDPRDAGLWQVVASALSRCREGLLDRLGAVAPPRKDFRGNRPRRAR